MIGVCSLLSRHGPVTGGSVRIVALPCGAYPSAHCLLANCPTLAASRSPRRSQRAANRAFGGA